MTGGDVTSRERLSWYGMRLPIDPPATCCTWLLLLISGVAPVAALRADDAPAATVEEESRPRDVARLMRWIDVRDEFGAVGDGVRDDTDSFQTALSRLGDPESSEHVTLFVPEGVYRISNTLRCPPGVTLQGDGASKTVLWLDAEADGFGDRSRPKPCLQFGGSALPESGSPPAGSWVCDLSIGIRDGNPGAVAVAIDDHSRVSLRDMIVLAEGDSGYAGIAVDGAQPLTASLERLALVGCDHGLIAGNRDSSIVLLNCEFKGQRRTGIENQGGTVSGELIRGEGPAPLIVNREGGLVTLINSDLLGGSRDAAGIDNEAVLYARNLKEQGYRQTIRQVPAPEAPHELPERSYKWGYLDEFVSIDLVQRDSRAALSLPVERPMEVSLGRPAQDWVSVADFSDRVTEGDWGPALQAAVDSGAHTVCIPQGCRIVLRSPVVIRANVQRLFGAQGGIEFEPQSDSEQIAIVVDSAQSGLIIERLSLPQLIHRSATTLIVRDCRLAPVHGEPECGRLFITNCVGRIEVAPGQSVWARHPVIDGDGGPVALSNNGGQLWVFGAHIDGAQRVLDNVRGARTGILGGWIRPLPEPVESPLFRNVDAELSLTHSLATDAGNLRPYLLDEREGQPVTVTEYRWFARRMVENLYRTPTMSVDQR